MHAEKIEGMLQGPEKDRFSSLDTMALLREIRAMPKAWLDKSFDLPEEGFLLSFHLQGGGRRDLWTIPGRFGVLRTEPAPRPESPGPLATEVRRWLSGAPLLEVLQPEGERYLEMTFGRSTEEEPLRLVLEFFGQGNVIVVRNGKIVVVAHPRAWSQRVLRVGETYVRPRPRRDPLRVTVGEVVAALQGSKADRVTTLAARLAFGGPLAEEILARAGIDPHGPSLEAPTRTAEAVLAALPELLAEVADPPRGYVYRDREEGRWIDVEPFRSRRWALVPGISEEAFPRFSDAAWEFFSHVSASTAPAAAPDPRAAERGSLERLRAQQEAAVETLRGQKQKALELAEAIYAHYTELEPLVEEARAAHPEEQSMEFPVGSALIPIQIHRPLQESAQRLYEEAKRVEPKLQGAQRALADTLARLGALDGGRAAQRAGGPGAPSAGAPRARHFWFEKAPRWFVSSEGVVVVGGRDARSNDLVVKKYLREADIYVHGEIHGAPSVVIRTPPPKGAPPVGLPTLREACQWGISYSKAWRAGHASGSAFWVRGDQVSKAGGSGEFVGQGSWVIHGTKNVEKDLPLELGLGTLTWEGEHLVQCAPPSSFSRSGASLKWLLRPGEERERDEVEKSLSRDLGVGRTLLQSLLPAGGLSAERR